MRRQLIYWSLLAVSLTTPVTYAAQAQDGQAEASEGVAQQCLSDLRRFSSKARNEGLLLGGWRMPATGPLLPTTTPPPAGQDDVTADQQVASGWTTIMRSPRNQIRMLYAAANTLAFRGEEQLCQSVLAELQAVYSEVSQQVGDDDGRLTRRQDQILGAVPVTKASQTMTSDEIIGTDVYNRRNEHLGSVTDLVVDPATGEMSYVIVAHGGFLGLGEERVAVPWELLQVAADVRLFVLPAPEAALENAPQVEPETLASLDHEAIDAYWE